MDDLILTLEKFIGFPIIRESISYESGISHDENFLDGLCLEFYNDQKSLNYIINLTTKIILRLI